MQYSLDNGDSIACAAWREQVLGWVRARKKEEGVCEGEKAGERRCVPVCVRERESYQGCHAIKDHTP